jgi:hypothetical protein
MERKAAWDLKMSTYIDIKSQMTHAKNHRRGTLGAGLQSRHPNREAGMDRFTSKRTNRPAVEAREATQASISGVASGVEQSEPRSRHLARKSNCQADTHR